MGQVVFVLLLASCFATGLGLKCYQCVSDPSWLKQFNVSLPYRQNCNSDPFDPEGVRTMTVTDSSDSDVLFLVPAQCIIWVIIDKGMSKHEVVIRNGARILGIVDPAESKTINEVSANNSSHRGMTDSLHDIAVLVELAQDLVNYFGSQAAAKAAITVEYCDSNLCNSVSGVQHSNAVLAMSVVVLMATLANLFN